MKRALAAAMVIAASVALTGCNPTTNPEKIREIAEARDECVDRGGQFEQFAGPLGDVQWICDFSTTKQEAEES